MKGKYMINKSIFFIIGLTIFRSSFSMLEQNELQNCKKRPRTETLDVLVDAISYMETPEYYIKRIKTLESQEQKLIEYEQTISMLKALRSDICGPDILLNTIVKLCVDINLLNSEIKKKDIMIDSLESRMDSIIEAYKDLNYDYHKVRSK